MLSLLFFINKRRNKNWKIAKKFQSTIWLQYMGYRIMLFVLEPNLLYAMLTLVQKKREIFNNHCQEV